MTKDAFLLTGISTIILHDICLSLVKSLYLQTAQGHESVMDRAFKNQTGHRGREREFFKRVVEKKVKNGLFGVIFLPICGISNMKNNVYVLP